MTSTQDTKEQAQQAALTAADEGKHVASVVGEEARNVAGEAKDQARALLDDAMAQVDEQALAQRDRLVSTLKSFSSDLEEMARSQDGGLATQLAQQVAGRSRALGDHLDGRASTDILDDVRRFARRRPAVFLLGALGAGVAVGRLARGAKQAQSQPSEPTSEHEIEAVDGSGAAAAVPASAPSYGQPEIVAPPPHGDPVYPVVAEDREDHEVTGTGPQGFLP